MVGTHFINKIYTYKFSPTRLGRFEAVDVSWLGRFGVGTFWGLGLFEAWGVLELGRFGVGSF